MNCEPPDLLAHADAQGHFVARYPWNRPTHDVRLSYDFECSVQEIAGPQPDAAASDDRPDEYLRPLWPAKLQLRVTSLLEKIGVDREADASASAMLIYHWILNNTFFSSTALPDTAILDTGFGSCADQARLFISLCRGAGIPARERCGALFTRTVDADHPRAMETCAVGASPFAHSWAEFHLADRGWMPIEFIGQNLGRRVLRRLNVSDAGLREELCAQTDLYDNYYFGALDPYRIHASPLATRLNFSPIFARGAAPAFGAAVKRVTHRLTCRPIS
jgi:hypothetical protein